MMLIMIYSLCVLAGVVGNLAVVTMIVRIFCNGNRSHTYVYVLALSLVDLMFAANGIFIITTTIVKRWLFGQLLCKMVYACEGLNRTLSVCLLVLLSADRHTAVYRPVVHARRTPRWAIMSLFAILVPVLISNLPIYVYTTVRWGICGLDFPRVVSLEGNDSARDHNNDTWQPRFSIWNDVGSFYTLFLLLFYFCVPTALILFYYFQTLQRLIANKMLIKRHRTRNRITRNVALVIGFYFVCWVPYWILQLIIQFSGIPAISEANSGVNETMAMCIYLVPYVNTAINPVFYAFVNRSLTDAYADVMRQSEQRRLNRRLQLFGSEENRRQKQMRNMSDGSLLYRNWRLNSTIDAIAFIGVPRMASIRRWAEKQNGYVETTVMTPPSPTIETTNEQPPRTRPFLYRQRSRSLL